MKSTLLLVSALLGAVLPLAAQDAPSRLVLDVDAPVVSVGKSFDVTLIARFDASAAVPATMLGGREGGGGSGDEMGSAPAPRSAPPARSAAPAPRAPAAQEPATGFDDMDDDIPF